MKKLLVVVAVCGLVMSGCVKKSEFEALQKKYDDTEAQRASLEESLGAAEAKIAELEAKIAELEADVAKKKEKLAKLRDKLANVVKDKAALKASAKELQRALEELEKRKRQMEARVAEFKDLLKRFQKMIDAGKLKVEIVDGRMVLVLATDVLFDSGSAKLSEDGIAAVTEVAQILAKMNNWELASGRALNVVSAMIEAGLPPEVVSAASFGEFHPVGTNDTAEGKSANRRIEIVLVPDLSTLPGFAQLKKAVEGK